MRIGSGWVRDPPKQHYPTCGARGRALRLPRPRLTPLAAVGFPPASPQGPTGRCHAPTRLPREESFAPPDTPPHTRCQSQHVRRISSRWHSGGLSLRCKGYIRRSGRMGALGASLGRIRRACGAFPRKYNPPTTCRSGCRTSRPGQAQGIARRDRSPARTTVRLGALGSAGRGIILPGHLEHELGCSIPPCHHMRRHLPRELEPPLLRVASFRWGWGVVPLAVAPPQRLPLVHFLRVIERHLATTFLCRRHCACLAAVGWRLVVVEELTTSEAEVADLSRGRVGGGSAHGVRGRAGGHDSRH